MNEIIGLCGTGGCARGLMPLLRTDFETSASRLAFIGGASGASDRVPLRRNGTENAIVMDGAQIGQSALISKLVTSTSNIRIGDFAYIGAGAAIRQDLTIGASSTNGMGAVVTNDVQAGLTVEQSGPHFWKSDAMLKAEIASWPSFSPKEVVAVAMSDGMFALDFWYVENRPILLDLKVLWLTVVRVLAQHGISAQGDATMPRFDGTN